MSWNAVLYLVPYIVSCVISGSVAIYAWKRPHIPGARFFALVSFGQASATFGFFLEVLSPTLDGKVFWDALQWIAGFPLKIALPLFVLQYLEYKPRQYKWFVMLLAVIPILFTLLLLTDGYHHLLYPDPQLVASEPFAVLTYNFTSTVWAYALYSYVIIFGCLALLLRNAIRPHRLYRSQVAMIAFGIAIPILGTMLTLMGVKFQPQRDITPITYAVGNLIVAWGLFRYRLFDIVPIARDSVVENLTDPVVVLDSQSRVVDLNPAALERLGKKSSEVIGRPSSEVYSAWPDIVKKFENVHEGKTEIKLRDQGIEFDYEISISPLYSRNSRRIGRVFVVRDITERVHLADDLKRLNGELEERVRERTAELAQAYDTTLQGWAKALELRDKETEGHSRRVTEMTVALAQALDRFSEEELIHIRRGALLHDIGKMAVPDEILRKEGSLTAAEKEIVAQHPVAAYELLSPIPFLEKALEIPYCHHEHWDGEGYPRKLKGEEIPLSARIFTIVDVWDALQSDRPYRKAWPKEKTVEYMREQSGILFDPGLVPVFINLLEQGKI